MVGIAEAELKTARGCFDGTTGVPERAVPAFVSGVSYALPVFTRWG